MKHCIKIFIILIALSPSQKLFAQMFSVGESQRRVSQPSSYLRIGFAPTQFKYVGNETVQGMPELLEINDNAFHANLETPGISLTLILANKLTGIKDKSFMDLGFTLTNNFPIVRRSILSLGVPLQLYSSITNSNNDQSQENFNQVNFAIGGGGFANLRISERLTLTNNFVPGYGFSNSSGGFFGGSMFYMKGKSRINFIDVFAGRSLSIGYDFNFRSFDIDQDLYDYELTSHLITIGISF